MTAETTAQVDDSAVRALLEEAHRRSAFVPRDLLELCAPEIRGAVAKAFLSDEDFSNDPKRYLADLVAKLQAPTDRAALEEARKTAIAQKDFARVRELTARILSTRVQGQTGEESR